MAGNLLSESNVMPKKPKKATAFVHLANQGVANLPAGEVYFVPKGATGSFPFRFSDGTLASMKVSEGAIVDAEFMRGDEELVNERNRKFKQDPATGIIGELGFGTQLLPFSGKDIQDEKILGTCHVATDGVITWVVRLLPNFSIREKMPPMTISYTLPTKTPEIIVSQVRMYKNDEVFPILENFEPTSFLLQKLETEYPVEKFASGVS